MHEYIVTPARSQGWNVIIVADVILDGSQPFVISLGCARMRVRNETEMSQQATIMRSIQWANSTDCGVFTLLLLVRVDLLWKSALPIPPTLTLAKHKCFCRAPKVSDFPWIALAGRLACLPFLVALLKGRAIAN